MILGIDGYLGWALALRLSKKHEVSGVDNQFTRKAVVEVESDSGLPILTPRERVKAAKELKGVNISYHECDVTSYKLLHDIIKKEKPEAIVHFAEERSAPYSMRDHTHAAYTMQNNIVGSINLIYAVKELNPKIHIVKMGCYSEDTEVLTEEGWKRFYDLKYTDKVCCLDPKTDSIVYSEPTAIVRYPYEGKMMRINTSNMDFLITPNHRVAYRRTGIQYKNNLGPVCIDTAENIYGKNFAIPKTCDWTAEEVEYFEVPVMSVRTYGGRHVTAQAQRYKMDEWLAFFGWYISEGCVRSRGEEPTGVCISQKTTSGKLHVLREAINRLGPNFVATVKQDKRRKDIVMCTFEISNNHLANYLSKFGKSGDKFIPTELKKLSRRQLDILFRALMLGDGHINKDTGSMYYYSKSEKLLSDVQEIAIKLGYGATICVHRRKNRENEKYLCLSRHPTGHIRKEAQTWENYKGFVHCCTVPTGIIMVRRNGKAGFSGNTMGEYGTPEFDIPESPYMDAKINGKDDKITTPKWGGSWYHWSKVHDTNNLLFANKLWGLTATNIMQGPVYGTRTTDITDERLFTRFDFDETWGTVINRYCVEAVLGMPLTPYGKGGQTRGFLSLEDSVEALRLLIENPAEQGSFR